MSLFIFSGGDFMNDQELQLLKNLNNEFYEFKTQLTEKINDLIDRENNDFEIFENIVCKLDDLSRLIEKSNSEVKTELIQINDTISEKIAMLMLRKF